MRETHGEPELRRQDHIVLGVRWAGLVRRGDAFTE